MNDPLDPPWHYLPHAPRRFFNLDVDATKENLKQAYSVLIRAFKPDKFPEEFKRIRAAYEQVDREFRYGMSEASALSMSRLPDGESEPTQGATAESSSEGPSHATPGNVSGQLDGADSPSHAHGAPRPSLSQTVQLSQRAAAYQRVESADPELWYAELASKTTKSSHDYYLLAVLSDIVARPSQSFPAWIAEGADKHPIDRDLSQLFQQLLASSQLSPDEVGELLLRLAKSMSPKSYYFLTESLWQRYVMIAPWEAFDTTLAACERALAGSHGPPRVAFSIAIMRRALWRAPLDWLHARKQWIEESRIALENQLEFDHELNCKLLVLREKHTHNLQDGPYGRRILESIQAFCEEGEWDAATRICTCQMDIASHPKEFLTEFAFSPEEDTEWCLGWQWISWLALSRLPTQEQPGENQWMVQSIFETMRGIDGRFPRSIERNIGLLNLVAAFAYFAACLIGMIFLIAFVTLVSLSLLGPQNEFYLTVTMGVLVCGVTGCIWLWMRLKKRWHARWIQPYIRKRVIRDYQSHWRLPIARSMQVLMCPYHFYYGFVQHLASDERNVVGPSKWLVPLMPSDLGLMLYSAAVPFAR